jgi:glucan phosphoethanolaminetransferase (alkaline phosphatase superfamily)
MITADLILLVHVAIILFVLLIPLIVLIWRRPARYWWRSRIAHLLLTAFIALQAVCGAQCPLTTWENALRHNNGQLAYQQGFIADWLHRLIFFDAQPWVFTLIYLGWFAVVAAGFYWIPLRRKARVVLADSVEQPIR